MRQQGRSVRDLAHDYIVPALEDPFCLFMDIADVKRTPVAYKVAQNATRMVAAGRSIRHEERGSHTHYDLVSYNEIPGLCTPVI
jgi:hypothetical protein